MGSSSPLSRRCPLRRHGKNSRDVPKTSEAPRKNAEADVPARMGRSSFGCNAGTEREVELMGAYSFLFRVPVVLSVSPVLSG
jgi:hypothetical protein